MNRPGKRYRVRGVAGGAAALLLLTGCGGGDGGGDSPARALGKAEVASVLPDAKAVPGWQNLTKPQAQERNPQFPPPVCLTAAKDKHRTACDRITFWGVSAFTRKSDRTALNFWTLAYKDEKSADAAYDALAGYYGGDRVGIGAVPVKIGDPGDEHLANRARTGTMGGPATLTQIRSGTTVLGVSTGTEGTSALSDQQVKDIAAMFTERAKQAQNGEKPTSALPGR
ncbi:hypothetical protein [Streptomyces sp. RKAG290]|uniref:hypothetical protein n=1 Tax=Streptomyces sp. RKAG290 TaxID=2888348 RepID=UPI0020349216|nr:hypothetical protein [Streptomyces sp. RKAG290]MCM2413022.1 hypothetical protein [Streptomyces sp. RKAG290]